MTPAAAPSIHVKRSVEKRIKAGHLDTVIHFPPAWIDGHLVDEYLVRSLRPGHDSHLVREELATGKVTCDCEAGARGLNCGHVEIVYMWQGRITTRIASADNQLTREAVYA